MNRAIILFNTGEVIDIKSQNALDVAETYLYHCFGFISDTRFKYFSSTDNKGVKYSIYIEKGER